MGASTVWSIASRVVWGDRVVWSDNMLGYASGTRVVWGDSSGLSVADTNAIVWGDVADPTLSSLTAGDDPFGAATLDEDRPAGCHHVKKMKGFKSKRQIERTRKRGERRMMAGGDR